MIRAAFLAALLLAGALPAQAGGASAANNTTNRQSNEGTVTLNPSGGSQTNINNNNAFSSSFSFGGGITCPTASVAANAYATNLDAYGVSISYIQPIGGQIGRACKDLALEVTKQRQLDTTVQLVNTCAELHRSGVSVDYAQVPDLAICQHITVQP